MVRPVELIPLVCLKCDTPVPAQPDEVAWVCTRCGQGLLLNESDDRGLSPLVVQYAAGLDPARPGKPFWVAEGSVQLQRSTYAALGPRLVLNPPALQAGPLAPFEPVTVSPEDLPALAEFIVLAIEAGRSDMLKQVQIQVRLSEPVLWVLP